MFDLSFKDKSCLFVKLIITFTLLFYFVFIKGISCLFIEHIDVNIFSTVLSDFKIME